MSSNDHVERRAEIRLLQPCGAPSVRGGPNGSYRGADRVRSRPSMVTAAPPAGRSATSPILARRRSTLRDRTPTDAGRESPEPRLRRLGTRDLTEVEVTAIRAIMDDAFGQDEDERFTDDDWDHALGGVHFVLDIDGGHRRPCLGRRARAPRRTAARSGPATSRRSPRHRPSRVVVMAPRSCAPRRTGSQSGFELGCLGTGRQHFYERLGWLTWRGPSSVRTPDGHASDPR